MTGATARLPRTFAVLEEGIAQRLHLGAQLYVSRAGQVLVDGVVGEDRPGVPLSPDHRMLWLSATKPITAVAVLQLWERGRLELDDPIARHLPRFAQGGKEAVTIRHALVHTGGFRMLDLPWPEGSWDEVIAAVCARRREPRWVPGKKAGYHHASSWFILGELVQRLDGRPFPRYVEEEVFAPLGMSDGSIGLPAERYRQLERDGRIARSWDMTGAAPVLYPWHEEAYVTRPSPGGNGRGPLSQLGRLYEALLAGGELDGHRVLSRAAVEALTARHRAGLYDHTFKHVLDWGLGVIVNARHYALIAGPGTPAASDRVPYGYGPHASYRTFGHSGYRSVVAFGDPEQHLAVALAWNGLPTDPQHEARLHRTLETLYAELDLAAVD